MDMGGGGEVISGFPQTHCGTQTIDGDITW